MDNEEEGPKWGPFNKDVMEVKKPLSEEHFIQERPNPSSFPAWVWLFLVAVLAALVWGSGNWYQGFINREVRSRPFLEVTNREFSLFLWQFPSFLRSNVKNKTGYLTGFQYGDKETLHVGMADEFVTAPPDLLFLYHTWNRLLASDFIARPIPANEFTEFLKQVEEWQPHYWKQAPEGYIKWLKSLNPADTQDLQNVPESILPVEVKRAFQGWKNYFKEGPEINQLTVTYGDLQAFITQYPTYARNYWRNIQEVTEQRVAGLNYLKSLENSVHLDETIPPQELSSFLRVALFNFQQAKKGQ